MYDLLIKNAVIVNADGMTNGAIAVKDGKTAAVTGESGTAEAAAETVIDASGRYVFPGFIDSHVHFNEPGYTWRENFTSGSDAAAAGGISMVIDMPMLNKPPVQDGAAFRAKLEHIQGKPVIDYGFWGALIRTNLNKLGELNSEGALAYKCFMCDPGDDYTALTPEEISSAFKTLKEFDGIAGFHCEDYAMIDALTRKKLDEKSFSRRDYLDSRPVEAELKATDTVLKLAQEQGARVHICHVSHPDVAQLVKDAKARGVRVSAETCLHYLIFDENDLIEKGMLFKCSPPLRTKEASKRLWDYVADGTIDLVCSDHSPAGAEEKNEDNSGTFGAWGGISGVQTMAQGLFDFAVNKMGASPCIIARLLSEAPAKAFSVYGRKGRIASGFDADFTIIDPDMHWRITNEELKYMHKISAFTGLEGRGKPVCTIVRGKPVCIGEAIDERLRGYGQLIKRTV